jgi:hypothetical protein
LNVIFRCAREEDWNICVLQSLTVVEEEEEEEVQNEHIVRR